VKRKPPRFSTMEGLTERSWKETTLHLKYTLEQKKEGKKSVDNTTPNTETSRGKFQDGIQTSIRGVQEGVNLHVQLRPAGD